MTTDWKSVRLFPIPSVIYLIHNNVQFATLMYVDTSTYQIMGNLKIVTTGILFRCVLTINFCILKLFFNVQNWGWSVMMMLFRDFLGCFLGRSFQIYNGWRLFYWLLERPRVRYILDSKLNCRYFVLWFVLRWLSMQVCGWLRCYEW